jgi:signal transduction histidine kinase
MRRQEILRTTVGSILIIIGLLLFNRYALRKTKYLAERMRISSDLHDEISSTLSSISMYSAYAKGKPAEAENILEQISSSSQEMIDDMNDIIWAVNPRNDSFEKTVDRLRTFSSRMAQSKNVVLDFRNDDAPRDVVLSMAQRKNIFLICKEAICNALKYSGCQTLAVSIHADHKNITAHQR